MTDCLVGITTTLMNGLKSLIKGIYIISAEVLTMIFHAKKVERRNYLRMINLHCPVKNLDMVREQAGDIVTEAGYEVYNTSPLELRYTEGKHSTKENPEVTLCSLREIVKFLDEAGKSKYLPAVLEGIMERSPHILETTDSKRIRVVYLDCENSGTSVVFDSRKRGIMMKLYEHIISKSGIYWLDG